MIATCLQSGNGGKAMKNGKHSSQRKSGGGGGGATEEEIAGVKPAEILDADSMPPEFYDPIKIGSARVVVSADTLLSAVNPLANIAPDVGLYELSFAVNGQLNTGATKGKEAVRVGVATIKAYKKRLRDWPDGVLLMNNPYTQDRRGDSRKKLYQSLGFGKTDSDGNQWAVLKNGRLNPLTQSQAFELATKKQALIDGR